MEFFLGAVVSFVVFYYLRQSLGDKTVAAVSSENGAAAAAAPVAEPVAVQAAPVVKPVQAETVPAPSMVAESSSPVIPQESVLRRHFVTHVGYMVESVNGIRPTDSVLKRHYDQLIASETEKCVNDSDYLQDLMIRFDEMKEAA